MDHRWWDDGDDEDAFNAVIQKAVLTYINKELPHIAKAWEESDVQGRKEDRTVAGTSASEASSMTASSASSCSDDCSEASTSSAGAFATYTHYSYLCAPPDGAWVDLKNGIELQR